MADKAERIQIKDRGEWRLWLEMNHSTEDGIWLATFKKHCGEMYVPHSDTIDEALCFGWIDSLPRKLDEDRSLYGLRPERKAAGGRSEIKIA